MTISIEYETDKKLDLDYDRIIRESFWRPWIMRNALMRQRSA